MMCRWRTEYLRLLAKGPRSAGGYCCFWGLWPISLLYGLIMRLRCILYRAGVFKSYRASVPVISVGNITTGGTGKTPMVDLLARMLRDRGASCAVVSRGYGGDYRQSVGRVSDAQGHLLMTVQECGDEPYLLAVRNPGVPVYVARRRELGVRAAEADGAGLLLLDDGFQHLAVRRDADIVLLDAKCPFGNGCTLPAGMLREPSSALRRVDLLVMTRTDTEPAVLPVKAPVVRSRHRLSRVMTTLDGTAVSAQDYVGKSCLAFAGIARPDDFFAALREFGFRDIEGIPLADHQVYDRETLNRLLGSCHNHDLLVTTEKDAVKLSSVDFPIPCFQVGVELTFDDLAPLDNLLDRIMESCR